MALPQFRSGGATTATTVPQWSAFIGGTGKQRRRLLENHTVSGPFRLAWPVLEPSQKLADDSAARTATQGQLAKKDE